MLPIWQTIVALLIIYVFISLITKTTKIVLKIVIIALLIGALVLGYTTPSDFWNDKDVETEEVEKTDNLTIVLENATNVTIANITGEMNETYINYSSGENA
jgi:hypothetical protein